MTASTTQDLTTMTPGEIDTQVAPIWEKEQQFRHHAAATQAKLDDRRYPLSDRFRAEYETWVADYRAEAAEQRALAEPFEAEFKRRGGWSRFFLVNNNNGHVHSSMECSTCFATTQFAWLPELSGKTEQEMVEQWGEVACTICFPSAPTFKGFGDGTSAFARLTAAEKAQRDAEKAAKRAAKAEKELVEPVKMSGRYGDTIRTVIAARNAISGMVQNVVYYGKRDEAAYDTDMAALEAALIAKGWTQEQIDKVKTNAEKKARKEMG